MRMRLAICQNAYCAQPNIDLHEDVHASQEEEAAFLCGFMLDMPMITTITTLIYGVAAIASVPFTCRHTP